jgi:hypothetical protein
MRDLREPGANRIVEQPTFSAEWLAAKVDWEGGVLGALDYGIVADRIEDPTLRALWADLQDRYRGLAPLVADIEERLRLLNEG